jgi:hypothetical protein
MILTGDSQATAERLAGEMGIDEVSAEVRPPRRRAESRSFSHGRRVRPSRAAWSRRSPTRLTAPATAKPTSSTS